VLQLFLSAAKLFHEKGEKEGRHAKRAERETSPNGAVQEVRRDEAGEQRWARVRQNPQRRERKDNNSQENTKNGG